MIVRRFGHLPWSASVLRQKQLPSVDPRHKKEIKKERKKERRVDPRGGDS